MNDKDKIIKLLEEKIMKLETELIEARLHKINFIPYVPETPFKPYWEHHDWWSNPKITCGSGYGTGGVA